MPADKAADIDSMNIKNIITALVLAVTTCAFAETYKTNVHASYYADKFHGKKTASGELFDMNDFTCAHKELPFGTILRVTNLENNRSVDVRVNDRGPYVAGREIDLSKAAARQLDMIRTGTATVKIEIVRLGSGDGKAAAAATTTKTTAAAVETAVKLDSTPAPQPTFWDIQVGSFEQHENANNLAQNLLKAGFEHVYFQKTDEVTRVVIKKVPDEKLKETEEKLRNFGISDYLVKKNS